MKVTRYTGLGPFHRREVEEKIFRFIKLGFYDDVTLQMVRDHLLARNYEFNVYGHRGRTEFTSIFDFIEVPRYFIKEFMNVDICQ